MDYVTSDNHGRFKELISLLKTVNFNSNDELIIAGDLLDRFSDITGLINLLRRPNVKLIKGNHEDLILKAHEQIDLLRFFENGTEEFSALREFKVNNDLTKLNKIVSKNYYLYLWFYNGGLVTLSNISKEDLKFFLECAKKAPYYIVKNNTLITHAGAGLMVNCKTIDDVVKQLQCDSSDNGVLWDTTFYRKVYLSYMGRDYFSNSENDKYLPCNIVFGHTGNENKLIEKNGHFIINLNGTQNSSVNLFCIDTKKLYKLTVSFNTCEI